MHSYHCGENSSGPPFRLRARAFAPMTVVFCGGDGDGNGGDGAFRCWCVLVLVMVMVVVVVALASCSAPRAKGNKSTGELAALLSNNSITELAEVSFPKPMLLCKSKWKRDRG